MTTMENVAVTPKSRLTVRLPAPFELMEYAPVSEPLRKIGSGSKGDGIRPFDGTRAVQIEDSEDILRVVVGIRPSIQQIAAQAWFPAPTGCGPFR